MGTKHSAEYDDAFNEGEMDNLNGLIRNDYEPGTDKWCGYEAGVKAVQPLREDFEAQAHYDAIWGPSLDTLDVTC
jgi:hypothetical protein